ncbi:MAG: hypothetical protein JWM93_1742 [Frankiales bacterium]|nr:hypothetical protein [Frankiales bacterium]
MRQLFEFNPPERFVAGTVGVPGERQFYLQARGGGRVVNVAVEKIQVAALAERVDEVLLELRRRGTDVADPVLAGVTDNAPLDVPIEPDFTCGTLAIAWEPEAQRVVIEALAVADEDTEVIPLTDAADGPDTLRVHLSAAAAKAFSTRATQVVAAGRPDCILCGQPMDPNGHVCPRSNGHH